jgi:N-acetylglucosaminyldiphosphoundecaprenol N-acetyl-beta-D-mannosaminyltransferase
MNWHFCMSKAKRFSTTEPSQPESYTVGGVRISSVDRVKAVNSFFQFVSAKRGGFITVRDAHGIVEAQTDNHLRNILNSAQMTLPDGAPIVWVGKLKNAAVQRVTGSDFFDDVISDPRASSIRHYFYGGPLETTSRVAAQATKLLGESAIAGWHAPPFRQAGTIEDAPVLAQITATRPDVIWVGLSTPKQEYWMANHTAYFPNAILVGIGAKFDLFAGVKQRAPIFVQWIGCEWLFRVFQEPKRLWPRYRRVVPKMIKVFISEVLHRNA